MGIVQVQDRGGEALDGFGGSLGEEDDASIRQIQDPAGGVEGRKGWLLARSDVRSCDGKCDTWW